MWWVGLSAGRWNVTRREASLTYSLRLLRVQAKHRHSPVPTATPGQVLPAGVVIRPLDPRAVGAEAALAVGPFSRHEVENGFPNVGDFPVVQELTFLVAKLTDQWSLRVKVALQEREEVAAVYVERGEPGLGLPHDAGDARLQHDHDIDEPVIGIAPVPYTIAIEVVLVRVRLQRAIVAGIEKTVPVSIQRLAKGVGDPRPEGIVAIVVDAVTDLRGSRKHRGIVVVAISLRHTRARGVAR